MLLLLLLLLLLLTLLILLIYWNIIIVYKVVYVVVVYLLPPFEWAHLGPCLGLNILKKFGDRSKSFRTVQEVGYIKVNIVIEAHTKN